MKKFIVLAIICLLLSASCDPSRITDELGNYLSGEIADTLLQSSIEGSYPAENYDITISNGTITVKDKSSDNVVCTLSAVRNWANVELAEGLPALGGTIDYGYQGQSEGVKLATLILSISSEQCETFISALAAIDGWNEYDFGTDPETSTGLWMYSNENLDRILSLTFSSVSGYSYGMITITEGGTEE